MWYLHFEKVTWAWSCMVLRCSDLAVHFCIQFVLSIGTVLLTPQYLDQGFKPCKIRSIILPILPCWGFCLVGFYLGIWLDSVWYWCSDAVFKISGTIWILLMADSLWCKSMKFLFLWDNTPLSSGYMCEVRFQTAKRLTSEPLNLPEMSIAIFRNNFIWAKLLYKWENSGTWQQNRILNG